MLVTLVAGISSRRHASCLALPHFWLPEGRSCSRRAFPRRRPAASKARSSLRKATVRARPVHRVLVGRAAASLEECGRAITWRWAHGGCFCPARWAVGGPARWVNPAAVQSPGWVCIMPAVFFAAYGVVVAVWGWAVVGGCSSAPTGRDSWPGLVRRRAGRRGTASSRSPNRAQTDWLSPDLVIGEAD